MSRAFSKIVVYVLICVLVTVKIQAQNGSILRSLQLSSAVLDKTVKFSVYLPPDYSATTDSFPALFLLHGFGGDENSWIDRCKLTNIVDSLQETKQIPPMVIIMPQGGNSYFINNFDSSFPYENYFVKEFLPHIDSVFKIKKGARHRAIAGLSMGGFGAVISTIKHPQLFGTVMSLSGAIRNEDIFKNLSQKSYNKFFSNVFGPDLVASERITQHWKNNSPYYLLDSTNIPILQQKNWYLDCGQQDHLFLANEAFHHLLTLNNIPHEYHMRQGKHNWEYWEKGFIRSLLYLDHKINNITND